MKKKGCVLLGLLFLFTVSPGKNAPEAQERFPPGTAKYILTDAAGGIFATDQKLTFALSSPGWLRLLLDGREIYRGRGPAYPELGLPWGEERGFSLTVEYYSPENVLVESCSWYIYIDKKPPPFPDMEIRNAGEGLRLVQSGGEDNARIRAWADIEGALVFFPDLAESFATASTGTANIAAANFAEEYRVPPAESFHAVVWAEDLAGNCSEPRPVFFEIPQLRIENPVPGVWLNPQTLIISGAEGKDVYWTADDSNPLEQGGTGRIYRGPERINKAGPVTLRIAWRDSSGLVREDSVAFSVTENLSGGRLSTDMSAAGLAAFQKTEERAISSPVLLPIPDAYLWSMGDNLFQERGGSVTLRPERLIKRSVALHLSAEGKSGVYRFAYLLDGTLNDVNRGFLVSSNSVNSLPTEQENIWPLDIISAGRSRVIVWPQEQGNIYFSWEGRGPWQEGRAPLPVPLEGGVLHWFCLNGEVGKESAAALAEKGESIAGPYSVTIAPIAGGREGRLRGRIAYRTYGKDSGWEFVSRLLDHVPGMVDNRAGSSTAVRQGRGFPLDVCDGEDLEWAFISSSGRIVEQFRRDRLAPAAPGLVAPPEGGWTRGPVTVVIVSGEEGTTGLLTARLRYSSGAVEMIAGRGSLDIVSSLGEAAQVTVEGVLLDPSGNRSQRTIRSFLIDPKTIYVSSRPLISASSEESPPLGVAPLGVAPGGMDNPFASLEDALDYALARDLKSIQIAGTLELRRPVTVSGTVRIDGGGRRDGAGDREADNRAVLVLGDGFYWNINPGACLTLSNLKAERKRGDNALIRAGKNGKLELSGSVLTHTGPLLVMDEGICEIRNSQVSSKIAGEQRIAAFSSRASEVQIVNSRIQLEGNYGLFFDLQGGNFSAKDSIFLCAGLTTATVFVFNGTRGILDNLILSAAAGDYASIMEASGSKLVFSGGTLGVSARDTSAILLDNSSAAFFGATFRVESSLTARALEIRGLFPEINNCRFYSTGSARRSVVFSGMEETALPDGSLTDNSFSGFTHIRRGIPVQPELSPVQSDGGSARGLPAGRIF